MSTALRTSGPDQRLSYGGAPARRAIVRWALRVSRREWRQQLLVIALLAVAVAATTFGSGLAANSGSSEEAAFGTANYLFSVPNSAADLAAVKKAFGTVEVIEHQKVAVPGSATPIDLRVQDPNGTFGHPMLRLDAGRYPSGSNQIAVTAAVAKIFKLHIGDTWMQGGKDRSVVGMVENPFNLLDAFALVAPGQAVPVDHLTILVRATAEAFAAAHIPDADIGIRSSGQAAATVAVLVLATIGLLFVGLVAVAGFTVMSQRRLRALGMLGAVGATHRHVRLAMLANGAIVGAAAAVIGAAAGLVAWIAFAPRMELIVEHRINRLDLPWWTIGAAMILAVTTAVAAAWWPARSAARIPIVAALSGRPSSPRPAHRFAVFGGALLLLGLGLLALSRPGRTPLIISGLVATTVGILLLAPVGIAGLAVVGGRAPIALRLALRDLARYQARSGAALAAAALAVGIAAVVTLGAAASEAAAVKADVTSGGNLPANQLMVRLSPPGDPGGLVSQLTSAELNSEKNRVNAIASSLHARSTMALYGPRDPAISVASGGGTVGTLHRVQLTNDKGSALVQASGPQPIETLGKAHHVVRDGKSGTEFRGEETIEPFVATTPLLEHFGIVPTAVRADTDILTSRASLAGYELIPGRHSDWHPKIQRVKLPTYTSDPNTLITPHAMRSLGFTAVPVAWLIETPKDLTGAQMDKTRQLAAAGGVTIESKRTQRSLDKLRTDATAAGVAVALGVLAMTVGLIRSETANDLRALTAAGASSTARRTLTAATAGSLALLAAVLGTGGAYLALIAWYRSRLGLLSDIPIVNLVGIVVGLPLVATIGGWLLSGREPPAIARQPIG